MLVLGSVVALLMQIAMGVLFLIVEKKERRCEALLLRVVRSEVRQRAELMRASEVVNANARELARIGRVVQSLETDAQLGKLGVKR